MIETPTELAIRLLHDNRIEIGRGVHRVLVKLNTRWGQIDVDAFAKNAEGLFAAVEVYLAGGGADVFLRLARDLMRVRKLGGFSGSDFNVAMHAYMPVVRKAFFARAPSLRQGLAAYDIVESVLLALITRLVEASARVDETTAPDAQPAFARPFEAVSVNEQVPEFLMDYAELDDDDDDEPTNPSGRTPSPRMAARPVTQSRRR
jgi:hypothetical protein